MKKIMMFGAVGAVTMAMGITGLASCHFADNTGNRTGNKGRTAVYAVSDESVKEYTHVFVDDNQDGICDNCHDDHGACVQDDSHHDSYYDGCAPGNAGSGGYGQAHHWERHGSGHHHR